MCHAHWEK